MSGGLLKGTIHRGACFYPFFIPQTISDPSLNKVVLPPKDQLKYRRLGVFHFAHFIGGIPLDPLPSKKVQTEGRKIFEGKVPTTDE